MLKKLLAITALTASFALPAISQADEVYSCKGQNSALHFVVYTDANDKPHGGHMYINGLQTAVLKTSRMNNISLHAKVKGNTANTTFIFNKARKAVYIYLGNTERKVCNARVRIN